MSALPSYQGEKFPLFDNFEAMKTTYREFYSLLNKVELSDQDVEFRPNYIASCRVMDTQRMIELLQQMNELAK